MDREFKRRAAVIKAHLKSDGDVGRYKFTKEFLAQLIGDQLHIDDSQTSAVLASLSQEGSITVREDGEFFVKVLRPERVGPSSLIRAFCARYYGEVSPLVDRKMTRALLQRFGTNYDIDSKDVQESFRTLQEEGLVKVLGRDDAYFKMLGAE